MDNHNNETQLKSKKSSFCLTTKTNPMMVVVKEDIVNASFSRNTNAIRHWCLCALKTTRDAVKFLAVGGILGALSTAGFAWKYSKSPHGAALSLGAGAVFGMSFGQEIANHSFQLYRLDTMAAQVKFMEWWQKKAGGQS